MKEACISNCVTPETMVSNKITNEMITEVKKKIKSRIERNSLEGK